MKTTLTISGVDQSIQPETLLAISKIFPTVEWGILFSYKNQGLPRYPSREWIQEFLAIKALYPLMFCSLHLCGSSVDDFIEGAESGSKSSAIITDMELFDRVQLNFTMPSQEWDTEQLRIAIGKWPKTVVTQFNPINAKFIPEVLTPNHQFLFDASKGEGKRGIESWYQTENYPIDRVMGYAGGLNESNIEEALIKVVGNGPFYLDLESGARDDTDPSKVDLDKIINLAGMSKSFLNYKREGL